MKLTAEELDWVKKRMDWYDIKFQEIYDEVADHIITGIEAARNGGDQRDIEKVFHTVVDNSFGGYLGIDRIVETYQKAFRQRMRRANYASYKFYFNRQTTLLLIFLLAFGFYLPANKITGMVLMGGLLLISLVPVVYAFINRVKIKTDKGKYSMLKNYIFSRAYLLLIFFAALLNSINILVKDFGLTFLKPAFYPAAVYMVLYYLFIVYGLSFIRLYKQTYKVASQ